MNSESLSLKLELLNSQLLITKAYINPIQVVNLHNDQLKEYYLTQLIDNKGICAIC